VRPRSAARFPPRIPDKPADVKGVPLKITRPPTSQPAIRVLGGRIAASARGGRHCISSAAPPAAQPAKRPEAIFPPWRQRLRIRARPRPGRTRRALWHGCGPVVQGRGAGRASCSSVPRSVNPPRRQQISQRFRRRDVPRIRCGTRPRCYVEGRPKPTPRRNTQLGLMRAEVQMGGGTKTTSAPRAPVLKKRRRKSSRARWSACSAFHAQEGPRGQVFREPPILLPAPPAALGR